MKTLFRHLAVIVWALMPVIRAGAYTHPSVPFTTADLDTLKANLNTEPWKSGYAALAADSHSQLTYSMQGPFETVQRAPNVNLNEWRNDMTAIYNLARMWYFTGNPAYAQKAHDILIAWAITQKTFGGGEAGLDLGDYVYCYAVGADILRGTWPDWTPADTSAVSDLFLTVYWPATGASVNAVGPANKGTLGMAAGAGIAAFCDDADKLNHIADLIRKSASAGLPNMLPTGEVGETGRDGGHSYHQWSSMAFAAEILWKQGIDVFSEMDNRLLAAGEYYARNNLGLNSPFVLFGTIDYFYLTPNPYLGWAPPRRGMAILRSAYRTRKGLATPYMDRMMSSLPVDSGNWMFEKLVDSSTATPLAPVVFPAAVRASTGFTDVNIGGATPTGGSSYSGGVWTVTGGGSEIWTHGTDSCHFTYKQVTGDCTMIARVDSASNTAANAKAGIMIRSDLTSSAAKRAWMGVRPDGGMEFYQHGWTSGGVWGGTNWEKGTRGFPTGTPYWLKIERLGTMISLYASVDGASWAAAGAAEYTDMPATAYIGFEVCSMVNGTAMTATFSNVSVTGGNGAAAVAVPAAPLAVMTAPGDNQVPVRWTGSNGATNYKVKRSTTSGAGYTSLATLSGTSFTDTTAVNGTTYYYIVTALNAVGESASSAEDSATPRASLVNVAITGTASASVASTGNQGSARAFDLNAGSKWFTGEANPTAWLQYDFGAGVTQAITSYAITAGDDMPQRDPSAWQFQGSANGSTWITLDAQSAQTFDYRYQTKTYATTNTTAYRYYRLNVTANSTTGYGLQLSEFALLKAGIPTPPPASPTGLAATPASGSQINLNWNAVSGASGYILKRASSSNGPYTVIASGVTATSYSDTGLAAGTSYSYVVSALGAGGESGDSASASATTLTTVVLSCVSIASQDGYVRETSSGSGTGSTISSTSLRAGDDSSNRQYKSFVSFDTSTIPDDATVTSAVLKLTVSSTTGTTPFSTHGLCYADIKAVSGFNGSTTLETTDFQAAADATQVATVAAPVNNLCTGALNAAGRSLIEKAGTTQIRIYFATGNNANATSNYVSWYPGDATTASNRPVLEVTYSRPAMPEGMTLVKRSTGGTATTSLGNAAYGEGADKAFDGSATTKWYTGGGTQPPAWLRYDFDAGQSWAVMRYDVTSANDVQGRDPKDWQFQGSNDGSTWVTLDVRSDEVFPARAYTKQYSFTNGTRYRYYQLNVTANYGGSSFGIQVAEVGLMAYDPPAAPASVTATGGEGQMVLSWSASANASSYTVRRAATSGGTYGVVASGLSGTGYTDSGLADGATWYYTITASGFAGEGSPSTPVSATTYTAMENWRFVNFGTRANTGSAADTADPDGDGWTNAREADAGTDPKDASSVLKIFSLKSQALNVVIAFPTVAGKSYRVEKSATLAAGSWVVVAASVDGTGGSVEITDAGARVQPRWFYRIVVLP